MRGPEENRRPHRCRKHQGTRVEKTAVDEFTTFVEQVEPRLRISLIARFGAQRGRDATAEGLAYAWENWESVREMEFPVAYLFKVGRSRTRDRRRRILRPDTQSEPPLVEPALAPALEDLSSMQRMAVVLVHAYGWTHAEAAVVMEVAEPTVKTHVQRALAKLRSVLEVETDA